MFGDNFAKELQSIPLSNDTVSRRIDDIAADVEQQLFGKLRDKLFSIQLDEATDTIKMLISLRMFDFGMKQGTQQLETGPGCEQTQEESIRTGPESVVANGVALARERKTKLTPPERNNCDVNGQVHSNDTQSSR
ncbi:hypothetical protein TNCV_2060901 [Trichonephila clavipes]|nr:hypothetical protein TNCV_2060901 [Trichonephila clavipes]